MLGASNVHSRKLPFDVAVWAFRMVPPGVGDIEVSRGLPPAISMSCNTWLNRSRQSQ